MIAIISNQWGFMMGIICNYKEPMWFIRNPVYGKAGCESLFRCLNLRKRGKFYPELFILKQISQEPLAIKKGLKGSSRFHKSRIPQFRQENKN